MGLFEGCISNLQPVPPEVCTSVVCHQGGTMQPQQLQTTVEQTRTDGPNLEEQCHSSLDDHSQVISQSFLAIKVVCINTRVSFTANCMDSDVPDGEEQSASHKNINITTKQAIKAKHTGIQEGIV